MTSETGPRHGARRSGRSGKYAGALVCMKNKTELSQVVAENLAKKALEKKITRIYFDRGFYKYHGRVKTFAETLRKNGMEF